MTSKERIHQLVDGLPENELEAENVYRQRCPSFLCPTPWPQRQTTMSGRTTWRADADERRSSLLEHSPLRRRLPKEFGLYHMSGHFRD